ncbi:MAG: low molecular weight phosphatase family protein [Candidatus Aenigmarchaeota archaeon]|nr:low molecular weight phosphatase family protein [Candidatus Aenigmarchaeota archaeon]
MKTLFVCVSNIFRSQFAEACLKKLGGTAQSAGVHGDEYDKIPDAIISIAGEVGLELGGPKMLSQELMDWADKIIALDRSVLEAVPAHYSKKLVLWDVPDTSVSNIKKLREIRDIVLEKVSQARK